MSSFSAPSGSPGKTAPAAGPSRDPRVLAQFHALYIVAEDDQGLVLVDQHAASERILYERLKKAALSEESVPTQPLLIPVLWELSRPEAEVVQSQLETFRKLGYLIEAFGEKTFRVTEAPAIIPEPELKDTLDAILRSLEDRGSAVTADEKILMMSACRAAVKANDRLSVKELSELLVHLSGCDNPHTCPHGRPTTVRISRQELDKKFGRI
jgi:DNA mismatch repair protein MutL